MKVFLWLITFSSGLPFGFFVYEAFRLWTVEPHEARAAVVLAAFSFVICGCAWRSFYAKA